MTEEAAVATHAQQSQAELLHLHDTLDHGFFSLAHANFKSPDRQRYGKDYYDERMKASHRFRFTEAAEKSTPNLSGVATSSRPILEAASVAMRRNNDSTARPSSKPPAQKNHDPGQHITSSHDGVATIIVDGEQNEEAETINGFSESDAETPTRDPLTWYGILVPPQLRIAQSSFSSVMNGALLQSLNAATKLRDLEGEIRILRKMIKKAEKIADI
nr:coiled-coil domain-containing protein 115 [Quercus suber]